MCGTNFNGGACCPPAQIIKEEICGNFNGELTDAAIWTAPAGTYISGTFQLFNSAASTAAVTADIENAAAVITALTAAQGNTVSASVDNPTSFTLTAAEGDSGTYCITLYKRVLA